MTLAFQLGRRLNVVIVAEGAVDTKGKKITPEEVQKVVEEKLKVRTMAETGRILFHSFIYFRCFAILQEMGDFLNNY